uniref:Uncharacterized protein n=1 Tax=Ditylenchus dipsaci TaxID=166011 RepID=A0A915E6W3_9BILA
MEVDDMKASTSASMPPITERIAQLQAKIKKFFELASLGDATMAYRQRHGAIWTGFSSDELTSSVENLLLESPAARGAALHFLGNMIHENAHLYFLRKEKSNLTEFYIGRAEKESYAIELLNWLFTLLAELGMQNSQRPVMKGSKAPPVLLDVFLNCPCIADLIHLLNKTFSFILMKAPEEAISVLIESARQGDKADWIWLHIANTFPSEVVPHLISIGIEDFRGYCNELGKQNISKIRLIQIQEECNYMFRSFSEFFTYLAEKKKNTVLKLKIREVIEDYFIKESSDPIGLLFVIKLFLISPVIFIFMIEDLKSYISTRSLISLISLGNHPAMLITILPRPFLHDFLIKMAMNVDLSILFGLTEQLVPIVMGDKELVRDIKTLPASLQTEVKDVALKMIDEILSRLLTIIHCERYLKKIDLTFLERYSNDDQLKRKSVESLLEGDEIGKFNAKILNIVCLHYGVQKAAELFSLLIYSAEDEKQLASFVEFALTVTPFYPEIMSLGVRELLKNTDKQVDRSESHKSELRRTRFVNNLLTLIQWQNTAKDEDSLKYLGLSMTDLRGELQISLMEWGLKYVFSIKELDETSVEVLDTFFNLMKAVVPRVQLQLKDPNRLLVQFSGMIVTLLTFINKVDFVCRCFAITGVFFSSQVGASKDLLISSLLNEAFENSAKLFGTSKNLTRIENEINFSQISPPHLLNFGLSSANEYSCLKELRSTPFGPKTAAYMAHSGTISSRHRRKLASTESGNETEKLRVLLFINMIDRLCLAGDGENYDPNTCRYLGEALTEHLCPDGTTSAFGWSTWEVERELTPKYVEINRQIEEEVPFCFDLLLMLSEVGLPGICFALPTLRAQFACALIQLETTPLKDSKVLPQALDRIAKVFAVLIAANNQEAYVILLYLWNFLQAILPAETQAIEQINISAFDETLCCPRTEPVKILWP